MDIFFSLVIFKLVMTVAPSNTWRPVLNWSLTMILGYICGITTQGRSFVVFLR